MGKSRRTFLFNKTDEIHTREGSKVWRTQIKLQKIFRFDLYKMRNFFAHFDFVLKRKRVVQH